jgi:hypothetical protein
VVRLQDFENIMIWKHDGQSTAKPLVLGSWLWIAFTGEDDNYIGRNFWTFYTRKNDISFDDNFLALHRISVFNTLGKFDFNPYCRLYFLHI